MNSQRRQLVTVNLVKEARAGQSAVVEATEEEVVTATFKADSHLLRIPLPMAISLKHRTLIQYGRIAPHSARRLSSNNILLHTQLLVELVGLVHHAHNQYRTTLLYILAFRQV
jgi:hypothetical protein